jgi:hypothetical protein
MAGRRANTLALPHPTQLHLNLFDEYATAQQLIQSYFFLILIYDLKSVVDIEYSEKSAQGLVLWG